MNLLYLFERQSLWMRRQLYVGVSSDSWSGSGGQHGDGLQVDAVQPMVDAYDMRRLLLSPAVQCCHPQLVLRCHL